MNLEPSSTSRQTHEVFNQPPRLEDYNLFEEDTALRELMRAAGASWVEEDCRTYGEMMGSAEWIRKGFRANENPPRFHSHGRQGHRIDFIDFHPAYHDFMEVGIRHGLHALPWASHRPGRHFARMALFYLHSQTEAGTGCPLSMTFACVPVLKKNEAVGKTWLPKIFSNRYDASDQEISHKKGATIGMAMTEKQGGTDVRANTTRAYPMGQAGAGQGYQITGHKWFYSAPMGDGFLTLAQTENGLSCFFIPRRKPDGERNTFFIQRLKDKLGNRSNASSEIEYREAYGILLGEEGRGVNTIIEMVMLTRYDNMIGSSALMRRAVSEAAHHIHYRKVMGKRLIDQPLMANVVADLCLEAEAALAMTARAAQSIERQEEEEHEKWLSRLLMPVGKYWICKRAVPLAGEALECLGGNGYVEEFILPRLYREAPLNSIWEGSGNVQCLDILRAISRNPESREAFFTELESARGGHKSFGPYIDETQKVLSEIGDAEYQARYLAERLAKAMQAAQLIKSGNTMVSDAFCDSRLGPVRGLNFGTLPSGIDSKAVIERARPKLVNK